MYDGLTSFAWLCPGVLGDARCVEHHRACGAGSDCSFGRPVLDKALSIALIIIVISILLPVPAAGQAPTPPQACASGWRQFVEVSRSADNDAPSGNDYGYPGVWPVDNFFVTPPGPFVVAVQEIARRNYSPALINVYVQAPVNIAGDLAGPGTFSYSPVLTPPAGAGPLRVQSQFVRYRIWYCLASEPTPTPTSTPTSAPLAGGVVCLPPPMPTSTPAPTSTPGTGALGAFVWPGLGATGTPVRTPTAILPTPLPTVCVVVPRVTPVVPAPITPNVRPIEFSGGIIRRECYDLWPGFTVDFSQIPLLSGLGTWSAPAFGVCVSYYDFTVAYDGVDLADYLVPAIAFASALVMFYYYRRG